MRSRPVHARSAIGENLRQLRAQGFGQRLAFCVRESVQHQPVDGQVNAAHAHPRVSASESRRSIFSASSFAASTRCAMATGTPACAAMNAAFRAMLRMLPPATLSCDSFLKSRFWVGVEDGNARL